jgi:hypothetical protein
MACHLVNMFTLTENQNTSKVTQTLEDCITRSVTHWSLDSVQHKERLGAMVQMFIDTCDPVTRVDNPSFRTMMAKLDPKFKMPGNLVTELNVIHYYLFST